MAEFISGSQESFVSQMNKKASELGMNDTVFKNCHGIDEDGHLTSAYDIAIMSRELMNNHPKITEYTTIWMDELRSGKSQLVNTNKLIRNYSGATGLKTGSTSISLYNLSATATRDDLSLIAVVMRSETSDIRFRDAQALLNYGFKNFEFANISKKGDILKSVKIDKGILPVVNAIFKKDTGILVKKGTSKNIVITIELADSFLAPVTEGQILGTVTYSLNNKILESVNLIAQKTIKKLTLPNMAARIFQEWINLLR